MIIYGVDKEEQEEMEKRFTYHAPLDGQPEKYEKIRKTAKDLAWLLHSSCPRSRELSLALTKLEESVMWANAAIARNEAADGGDADHSP